MNNPVKIRYKRKKNKFAGTVMFVLIFLLSVSTIITIQLRARTRNKQIDETAASTSSQEVIVNEITDEEIIIEEFQDNEVYENEPDETEPVTKEQKPVFAMPVNGVIIKEYSPDNLIYSNTMGDWRQHMGTDIKCEYESEVSSMCDGVVTDIYNDAEYGTTIAISHPDDTVTRYSNINISGNISVGTKVKSGDIIGSVISNPTSEIEDELHVHIEASRGSVRVDPISLVD